MILAKLYLHTNYYSSSSTAAQKAAAGFINANFVAENFDSFASTNNGIFP